MVTLIRLLGPIYFRSLVGTYVRAHESYIYKTMFSRCFINGVDSFFVSSSWQSPFTLRELSLHPGWAVLRPLRLFPFLIGCLTVGGISSGWKMHTRYQFNGFIRTSPAVSQTDDIIAHTVVSFRTLAPS